MGQMFEFVSNHPVLFAALALILAMLIMNEFRRHLLGFKEIGPSDAVRMINHDGAVVIDVRDDLEFKSGHIINAVNAPLGVLEEKVDKLADYKDKPVIICCQSGQRSAKAGALLQRQGFSSIFKLSGGLAAWSSANLPLKK